MVLGGASHIGTITAGSDVQIPACGSSGIERWATWAFWYLPMQCAPETAWHTPLGFQVPEQATVPKPPCRRVCLPPQ